MDKVRENRLRRQAKRLGLLLCKSRAKRVHVDNLGGYMIVDARLNLCLAGERFQYDLNDVADFLTDYEGQLASPDRPATEEADA